MWIEPVLMIFACGLLSNFSSHFGGLKGLKGIQTHSRPYIYQLRNFSQYVGFLNSLNAAEIELLRRARINDTVVDGTSCIST